MQHVNVSRHFAAAPEKVWDIYTDHVGWGRWAGVGKVELAREGTPAPNGVGCVRVIKTAGVGVHEEIIRFERPRQMSYRLIKGPVPLKDHLGEIILAAENGGTRLTWQCHFNSVIPGLGAAQRWYITRLFNQILDALARQL